MQHFRLLAYPEQIIPTTRGAAVPVVPLWFPRGDLDRIVPWLIRRHHPFAFAHDRHLVPHERFATALPLVDRLFCFTPDAVEEARTARFAGELFLFSNGAMLAWPQWYRDHAARPVVATLPDWEEAAELDPVFLVTTKSCVAEFGACRSREGTLQQFVRCDGRCRDKAPDRRPVESPFSVRPSLRHPAGATAILSYDEHLLDGLSPAAGKPPAPELAEVWDHRWPIGRRILTEAHRTGDTRFYFNLHDEERALWEAGSLAFWAYERSLYDGAWAVPLRTTPVKGRLLITLASPARKLLMVQVHDKDSFDLFKRARHQIYTMPREELFAAPDAPDPPGDLAAVAPKRLVVVLDDLDRRSFFRSRDMDRVALLHTGGLVGRFFNQYVYLPFPVSADEARRIAEHHRLRGIVVQDRLMRRMFEVLCKGEKEVLLHPAMIDPDESGPSCIVACGQMFRSRYRSPGRGRRWESLRVRPYDLRSGTLYLKDSPWSRTGDVPELWVDVIGADDTTVRAVKVRAERLLREKKKEA